MMHRWQRCRFLLQKKGASGDHRGEWQGKIYIIKDTDRRTAGTWRQLQIRAERGGGYFDQQKAVMEQAPPQQTVLENFWAAYPGYLRGEGAQRARRLFIFRGGCGEKMGQLSGGEKVRLALCKMLQTRPNLLILDEPTNHMDIIGKEALEQMLREYEGTVLFVSHDRYFISRITTGILEFSGDAVRQYAMNYEEYLAEKQKCAGGVAANAGSAAGRNAGGTAERNAGSKGTGGVAAEAGNAAGRNMGSAAGQGAHVRRGGGYRQCSDALGCFLTRRPITIRARCAPGCSARRKSMSGCLRRARRSWRSFRCRC